MSFVRELKDGLVGEIQKEFFGQTELVEYCLMALLCEGHVLLEGVPGTAKTLLARTIASALSLDFGRVQFTPDLLPTDVVGTNIFNFRKNEFVLRKGPVFENILLADEINRTPPKTQSALLEAMQERQVTIDGTTYDLKEPFLVVATQNPIEQEGTYPLPEAQLDRFFLKLKMEYPSEDTEEKIIKEYAGTRNVREMQESGIHFSGGKEELNRAKQEIKEVCVEQPVVNYIVQIIRATRQSPHVDTGASPRASVMLTIAAKGSAAMEGREYVVPDDVKKMAGPALRHRLVLSPSSEIEGMDSDQILEEILSNVEVPR